MVMTKKNVQPQTTIKDPKQVWRENTDTIHQFLEQRPDYEQLCVEIAYILKRRLGALGIEVSTVTWRAKTLNSFLEKIERKKYANPFAEITDFAGVRVVYLYNDDLQAIEKAVREEFEVIEKVDKLNDKGVDRFGYGAIHFIVKLGEGSSGARYDDLKNLVCEIQVRTVLQDAWAIIDHHLVYKNESDVPTPLQRKLNSLAGLFETADDQFNRLRGERAAYLAEVKESQSDPLQFLSNELNKDSFPEYVRWKFPGISIDRPKLIDMILSQMKNRKYATLADLDEAVEKAKGAYAEFESQLEGNDRVYISDAVGVVLFHLLLIDSEMRDLWGFTPEVNEALKKYAVY